MVKISPQELKNWLLAYFCMGNPKKLVPRRSADPPDSSSGGFCWHYLLKCIKITKDEELEKNIWTICPRPKTTERLHASRHNNASNCVMVCTPKQIHPSKHLGNNSYFFLMTFFFKHGLCHNGKRQWSREILEKRRRRIEFVKHFRTHLGKKRLFILLLWLLKNSSNGQNRFFILKFKSKRDL